MKSKKIVAMIVAFAAFMAVATSGLAATTTYNYLNDGYVDVRVEATADEGSEVTYLVETPNEIVYIDQQTADDGVVNFNYKILASKLDGVTTTVKFGTDGENAPTGIDQLKFADANVTGENITVTYWKDKNCTSDAINGVPSLGTGDTVYAKVEAVTDYKLVSYTVNGATTPKDAASYVIPVKSTDVITVATEKIVVDPGVQDIEIDSSAWEAPEEEVENDKGEMIKAVAVTKIFKVIGNPTEVGVKWTNPANGKEIEFPAMRSHTTADGQVITSDICAVRIMSGENIVVDGLTPYFN